MISIDNLHLYINKEIKTFSKTFKKFFVMIIAYLRFLKSNLLFIKPVSDKKEDYQITFY